MTTFRLVAAGSGSSRRVFASIAGAKADNASTADLHMRIRWLAAGAGGRIVTSPARAGPWRAAPASGPALRRPRRLSRAARSFARRTPR
ncbi:hypothetical protein BC2230_10897 [Burkholderia cepacia]